MSKREEELKQYETKVKNEGKKFKLLCKEVARMEQQAKREIKRSMSSNKKQRPEEGSTH